MSPAKGGRGVKQTSDKSVTRGRGFKPKSDVTTPKQYHFNNRIRMTLKVVTTPLHLLFDVDFDVDNKVLVENMHILANMRSKICIKGRLIISSKFVTILVVTGGGGGQDKRRQSLIREGVQNRW